MIASIVDRVKANSGIFPTLFDIPEVWRLNSNRCGGRFNLIFFWLYPLAVPVLLVPTVLTLVETLLTPTSHPQATQSFHGNKPTEESGDHDDH